MSVENCAVFLCFELHRLHIWSMYMYMCVWNKRSKTKKAKPLLFYGCFSPHATHVGLQVPIGKLFRFAVHIPAAVPLYLQHRSAVALFAFRLNFLLKISVKVSDAVRLSC